MTPKKKNLIVETLPSAPYLDRIHMIMLIMVSKFTTYDAYFIEQIIINATVKQS